jgi:multiple sugar transport system substrate-binding protein
MLRLAPLGFLLLCTAALLGGCRGDGPEPSGAAPIRLVYWPPPNRFDIEMSRQLVADWNQRHPEIQVEMQPLPAGRSSEEVLLAAIVGRTTPDICSNILSGTVERMVRAGALVPLSRFSDFEAHLRGRLPIGAVEQFRNGDGQYYQMPWKANPTMLLYNATLMARHGLQPPRTYSQLLELGAKVKRDLDGDGRVDQWAVGLSIDNTWWKRFDDVYPLYIAASGGRTLIDGKRVLFDGPDRSLVRVFELLRQLFARGYAPRSYFAAELFLQGRVAMITGSAPSIPDIAAKRPAFQYDFAPLPLPDDRLSAPGPRYTFGDIKSMVVFSSCRHPEAAWRFIQHLTSARADHLLLTRASQIPLRRRLFESEPFASALRSAPLLATLARHVEHLRGTDDTPQLVEIFDTVSQAYEAGAIHGVVPAEQAVHKAARRVQQILERWN